jgi:hypothetical protein
MGLDSNYVTAPSLEMYFVSKDTGLPLTNGTVWFFADNDRTIMKSVFELSGVQPNYTYTPLPNPVTLSSVGTFQDGSGVNVIPYYYPFDSAGNVQLYYIEVYDMNGVLQFTREGWPNFTAASSPSNQNATNFVPNPQFILHNDAPLNMPLSGPQTKTTLNYGGSIGSQDIWAIAPGGWTFQKNTGSTSVDSVTFPRFDAAVTNPGGNPRYAVDITTTVAGSDATKDLVLTFPDVNSFASPSQAYNLFFEGISNNNTNINNVEIIVRKYFGVGGSATTETPISTITLTTAWAIYNTPIIFGTNIASTIGPNDDDFVQIIIRLPPTGVQSASFTDFALTLGDAPLTEFPPSSITQQIEDSTIGWLEAPLPTDGSGFYLPVVLTPQGSTYDLSEVGVIVAKFQLSTNPVNNELFMNGSTYVSSAYSSLGIPYSRLSNFLMNNSSAISVSNGTGLSTLPAGYIPLFGTGPNFVSIFINATAGKFDLNMNTSSVSNGADNGTSGFTNASADPLYVFTVPAVPTAGTFFSFTVATGGTKVYNVWFTVNGAGTAPTTPTGANIKVSLITGDTVATTIAKIAKAVNGYQFMLINLQGYFLRGLDTTGTIDPDAASRTSLGIYDNLNRWTGAFLATVEPAAFASHVHPPLAPTSTISGIGGGNSSFTSGGNRSDVLSTGPAGGSETRPINIAVNYFIKY